MDRCEECGFAYDLSETPTAAPAILDGVGEFAAMLSGSATDLRSRPEPQTWSILEYGCHLRDVLLMQRERVLAAAVWIDHPST